MYTYDLKELGCCGVARQPVATIWLFARPIGFNFQNRFQDRGVLDVGEHVPPVCSREHVNPQPREQYVIDLFQQR